jgi:hypothetical protein
LMSARIDTVLSATGLISSRTLMFYETFVRRRFAFPIYAFRLTYIRIFVNNEEAVEFTANHRRG